MISKNTEESEVILSLSDFKLLCLRYKKKIWVISTIAALLGAFYALTKPIVYTSEATFREKSKTDSNANFNVTSVILGGSSNQENLAMTTIKSRKIAESVVIAMGDQGVVTYRSRFPRIFVRIGKTLARMKDNLKVEWAYLNNRPIPSLPDAQPALWLSDISYPGEVPRALEITFLSNTKFRITDRVKGELGIGELDRPVVVDALRFNLHHRGEDSIVGNTYDLDLLPLSKVSEELAKNVKGITDFKDKTFLKLSLIYPSRIGSSKVLNAFIDSYRNYLLQEHHRVVADQLVYLKNRQLTMDVQLTELMKKHVENLSAPSGNLELLMQTQQNFKKRLLNIDLEVKHLKKGQEEGSYFYERYSSENDPLVVHHTLGEIRRYKQQSDAIEILLRNNRSVLKENPQLEFQGIDLETANGLYLGYSKELHLIEAEIAQNAFIIQQIATPDFELSSLTTVLHDTVSKELISKAGGISLMLKDQSNRTLKEQERLKQELDLQRGFLTMHIQQIIELAKLRENLLKNKILALQNATLELIQQKISILEKHLTDYTVSRIEFDKMRHAIEMMHPGSVLLVHASCHNPTGMDLTFDQWKELSDLVKKQKIVPFFDCAYQGFAHGIEADVKPIRYFYEQGHEMLVAYSFSKNFGLYGERVGALAIVTHDPNIAKRVGSQVKNIIRGAYSNAPLQGPRIVSTILKSPELAQEWTHELTNMRERVKEMRRNLVAGLQAQSKKHDFSFLSNQLGLFSFCGLTHHNVQELKKKYGIFLPDSGRINVAGLNGNNIDYVIKSILSSMES